MAAVPDDAACGVEIEIHERFKTTIVTLRGEHDLTTQLRVKEALARAGETPRVLVDLSECTFADSSVIRALITAHGEISRREGNLEVVIPPAATAARRVADLTSLAEIIPIHTARNGLPPPSGGEAA